MPSGEKIGVSHCLGVGPAPSARTGLQAEISRHAEGVFSGFSGRFLETRRHCFDRFHQGDKSHRASGSGLGLAIAREIMTRLGARLTVHSELGEGSEFSFTLCQENQA